MSKLKIFLLLIVTTILAYGSSVFYGFSQDDWFHLSISRASNLAEFVNFFNPSQVSWIFFRPLSTQLPYWLATTIFPLTQAATFMHVLMLLLHTINAYLVVLISKKYLRPGVAMLLGIFYAASSIHFLSLFYIGAIQELISTLFSLLAIHHYLCSKRQLPWLIALLTLGALLSKELAVRLPIILFILSLLKNKKLLLTIKDIAYPVAITIAYFALRIIFGITSASEYAVVLSPGPTIATIMWYLLFLVGFPERILSYGLSLGQIDLFKFMSDFRWSTLPIFFSLLAFIGLTISHLIHSFKSREYLDLLVFPFVGFVSLAPILFLPTHRYPHYLDLFILFVGIWLLRRIKKLSWSTYLIFGVVVLGSLCSISIEKQTHWTIQRSLDSSAQINHIVESCDDPKGVVFTGTPDELKELSYALSVANGPRVICKSSTLQVYYKEQP